MGILDMLAASIKTFKRYLAIALVGMSGHASASPGNQGPFRDDPFAGEAIDRETAREKIVAIPAIKALGSAVLENGGLGIEVVVDDQPVAHLASHYWEVHAYEKHKDRHPRFETFLVENDGKEILVLNFLDVGPRYRTLAEWIGEREVGRNNPYRGGSLAIVARFCTLAAIFALAGIATLTIRGES